MTNNKKYLIAALVALVAALFYYKPGFAGAFPEDHYTTDNMTEVSCFRYESSNSRGIAELFGDCVTSSERTAQKAISFTGDTARKFLDWIYDED